MLCPVLRLQGTPVFNAPTLSAKGLLQFAQGVLVLRKQYRSMLSPPMFDSPRAIRSAWMQHSDLQLLVDNLLSHGGCMLLRCVRPAC